MAADQLVTDVAISWGDTVRVKPGAPASAVLEALTRHIGDCSRCKLCRGRTNLVFGVGNPEARLMFVGEGPGQTEDAQGRPFVGRAGELLVRLLASIGWRRQRMRASSKAARAT